MSGPGARRERELALRHALVLGLLHGPTELLPISSSAHTTLVPWLLDWPYGELDPRLRKSFEVALHAGAGLALALAMRRQLAGDLARADARRAGMLALALAPPALAGLLLGERIERRLGGPRSIAAGLAVGGLAMVFADGRAAARRDRRAAARPDGRSGARSERRCAEAGPLDGLALGVAQAAALLPGVSRSGAALSAARARGFARAAAVRLSWAVGLPVFAGASLLQGVRLLGRGVPAPLRWSFAAGAASAFASTLASAALLGRGRLARLGLGPFAVYRGLLAAAVLVRARRARVA